MESPIEVYQQVQAAVEVELEARAQARQEIVIAT